MFPTRILKKQIPNLQRVDENTVIFIKYQFSENGLATQRPKLTIL